MNTNTSFGGAIAGNATNLTKVGTGSLILNGNTTYNAGGSLNANGGTVAIDLSNLGTPTTLWSTALSVGGGTFSVLEKSGTASTQTFTGTTVNAGSSAITASQNGGGAGMLLQLTGITRNAGGTVDFTNPSGAPSATNGITTTTANNAAGILGGYATVGGTDWAVSGASATVPISAFTGYTGMVTTGGSTTTNYSLAGAGTNLSSGAVTINSLKLTDTGASQSLSLAGNNLTFTNALGGLLFAGGTSNAYTIYGGNGVDGTGVIGGGTAAANEFIVNVKSGATLTMTVPIINTGTASTGFLTTAGGGTLILNSTTASTFTGTSNLNAGIVQITQDGNLGTGGLAMNGGTLKLVSGGSYGGGTLFSNNRGIALGNNGGTIDTNGSSVSFGGVISGGTVATTSANTAGGFSFTKAGLGTLTLTTNNTYGGATIITGGVLSVNNLNATETANGGVTSSIGQAPNTAPYLVLNGGTLQYAGGTASTDRQFTLGANGGVLDASGSGALAWNGNSGSGGTAVNAVAQPGSGARTLTLTGSNAGANTFAMILGDSSAGATSLTKSGAGQWVLSAANTYSGATTISGGSGSTLTLTASGTNNIASSKSITVGTNATFSVANVGGTGANAFALNGTGNQSTSQILGGNGTVTGAVAISNGATLSAGTNSGTGKVKVVSSPASSAPLPATGSTDTIGTLTTGALTLGASSGAMLIWQSRFPMSRPRELRSPALPEPTTTLSPRGQSLCRPIRPRSRQTRSTSSCWGTERWPPQRRTPPR